MINKKLTISLLVGITLFLGTLWFTLPFLRKPILTEYNVNKIVTFTIYDANPLNVQSNKPLHDKINIEMDPNQVKFLFKNIEYRRYFSFLDKPLWKGGSLGVIEFSDGTNLRLALSYLGYVRVVGEKSIYYGFNNKESSREWKKVFVEEIVQGYFVPKRREKALERSTRLPVLK